MARLWSKKALLVKTETTYGTDATPTGGANAVLATNVQITPMEGQEVSRDLEQPYLGAQPTVIVGRHVSMTYEVELASSGTLGTAPAWGPILMACGFGETVTAGASVAYSPISTGFTSVTKYLNIDGVNHVALGGRGSVTIRANAQQIPKLVFTFKGLYLAPAETTLPTVDFSAFKDGIPVTDTNTPTFQLNGVDLAMSEFELDMANQVEGRFLVNQERVVIVNRKPTARCNVEAPGLGAFNPFALAGPPATYVPLLLTHGVGAGNVVEVASPRLQIGRPTYTQVQGITHYQLPLVPLPTDAGNDEVTITVK